MKKHLLIVITLLTLSQLAYAQSATILPGTSTFSRNVGDFSNQSTVAGAYSVRATMSSASSGSSSAAVRGINNGTGPGMGVWGSHAGTGWGVYGTSTSGVGVYGVGTASAIGVYGSSTSGRGIYGTSTSGVAGEFNITSATNNNSAIIGQVASTSSDVYAIQGIITSTAPGGFSAGVRGISNGTGGLGIGVYGSHAGSGWGVYGVTPNGLGVYGNSTSGGYGVFGNSNTGIGVNGNSTNGTGIKATSVNGTPGLFELTESTNLNPALMAVNSTTNASVSAIQGVMSSTAPGGFSSGVRGISNGTGGLGIGVWGSHAGSGWGVYGVTPNGLGIYGNSSASGIGVFANSYSGTGLNSTSNNGIAAKIEINNNANANTALITSSVGDGTVIQVTKASSTGNGAGLVIQKDVPFSAAYTTNAHADLEIRHPILGTNGMTGLRILNTGSSANNWTLYTNNSGGALSLFFNGILKGEFVSATGAYTSFSDERLKNSILPYASTIDNLMKVGVKSYKLNNSDKTEIGLMAQEVLQYFPEIVYNNTNDKGEQFYTMDYARIGVLAVKAIQEQQKEIDELRKEIAELKALVKK